MSVHAFVSDAIFTQHLAPLAGKLGRCAIRRLPSAEALLAIGPRDGGPDLYVVEEALLQQEPARRTAVMRRRGLVLLTAQDVESTIRLFAENEALRHVHSINDALLGRQLETTLAQILADAPLPLTRYLASGASLQSMVVKSSQAKQGVIDAIVFDVAPVVAFADLAGVVATVTSELLMNAVFNAPHDAKRGLPKYRDLPRDETLTLAAGEEVRAFFGHDEGALVLGVEDRFGMLSRATLAANLLRASRIGAAQIKMQTAGAGVGLYMVINAATQLDVYVERGKLTRLTAVIGVSKRYRDFERLGHSLNYFGKEGDG